MLYSKVQEEGEGEETTTTKTKEKRKNKKLLFNSRQTFKSEQEPFFHILYGKNDYN